MAAESARRFRPDPPPESADRELAEWLMRQFERLASASGQISDGQDTGQSDLSAHIADRNNPHVVTASQAGAVDKVSDDTKNGKLVMDGSAILSDIVLKGSAYPLSQTPPDGAGIEFTDESDETVGGMVVYIPDPVNAPEMHAVGFGSLADNTLASVIGAGILLDSDALIIGVGGAQVGSRLVCAGFSLAGQPILGWEDPPPPDYDDSCQNNTDQLIRDTTGQGPWVHVCAISISEEIAAGRTYYLYWSIIADNRSSRTGSMDIGISVDGATPTGPSQTVSIVANFYEVVSGSETGIAGATFPIGTTLDLWVRGNGDHNQFDLWTAGTDQPSQFDLQVR